ncbi:hypothetical protein [Aeoliella sp. SH292]|uniref:hypothetical protein n=1 Tax=Aeoliella sp. SH292 TaxID=3454464 RepID=UPI003F9B88CA
MKTSLRVLAPLRETFITACLVCCCLFLFASTTIAQEEATPLAKSLALDYWDESRFAKFEDGVPLTIDERREVERLVSRLSNFDRRVFYASPSTEVTTAELLADPAKYRGKPVRWFGKAEKLIKPEGPSDASSPSEPAMTCIGRDDSGMCLMMTRSVPERWSLFELESEPIGVNGVFVKLVETDEGVIAPLIAVPHIEWMPTKWSPPAVNYGMSVLGILGIDVALLDNIVQRERLLGSETMAFYRILAATRGTTANELSNWAQRHMPRHREEWAGLEKSPDLNERRLAAEVLRQAKEDRYSVAPFFNQPKDEVGQLAVFDGVVRRALRIDTSDNADAAAVGIDHYYELALFTDDSQNNPLVFCVLDLPEGFPQGDDVREQVRLAGFFFKTWRYGSREGDGRSSQIRFAPLFIGRGPLRLVEPAEQPIWGWIAGISFMGVIALVWLANIYRARGDRAFAASTLARIKEPVDLSDLDRPPSAEDTELGPADEQDGDDQDSDYLRRDRPLE